MDLPAISVASGAKATASNVYQKRNDEYGPAEAFDNDPETRWATDSGTKKAWIAVDLGKPLAIQRVRIEEAYGNRIQKFELQFREGQRMEDHIHRQNHRPLVPAKIRPCQSAGIPAGNLRRDRWSDHCGYRVFREMIAVRHE